VKYADGLELIHGFDAGPDHPELHRQREQQQGVIARYPEQSLTRHQKYGSEEQAGKQTGTRFLDAEIPELDNKAPHTGQFRPVGRRHQMVININEHEWPASVKQIVESNEAHQITGGNGLPRRIVDQAIAPYGRGQYR